jgi:pimeloyl-ACP methyl ester carboxylesterase
MKSFKRNYNDYEEAIMHPDSPSSAETQYIEMEGGVTAFKDEGSGPVLICIHGIPGSSRDFRWLTPVLVPHLRVLRIDLPGFGKTQRAAHPSPDMVINHPFS